ncbi:ribokinase [Corynebacterium sp. ZY180755]
MSNKPAITVVGSINADLTSHVQRHPIPGETLIGSGGGITAGGKGANQAVAAALLGANVNMIGAVGKDPYAEPATAMLQSSGVNMAGVEEVDAVTGLAIITVSADGENTIIVIPGANSCVDESYVAKYEETIAGSDIVLLQGEIPADGFAKAVELAKAHGTRVVTNLAPVIDVNREALLTADPLMANEHEAGLILDQLGIIHDKDAAPEMLVEQLLGAGFNSVVLTLGSKGAVVAEADAVTAIPTPKITAVDTTGAGDAFAGAFVAKLADGATLVDAAHFAARVGAFAATGYGAQASYPNLDCELPCVE